MYVYVLLVVSLPMPERIGKGITPLQSAAISQCSGNETTCLCGRNARLYGE